MSEFAVNLLFCAAYILSGAVILLCLNKFGFKVAKTVFTVVYVLLMTYVPFYICGTGLVSFVGGRMRGSMAYFFEQNMQKILSAPTPIFQSVSVVTLALAVIVAIATLLVLWYLSVALVRAIERAVAVWRVKRDPRIRFARLYTPFVAANNKLFLDLCDLRN